MLVQFSLDHLFHITISNLEYIGTTIGFGLQVNLERFCIVYDDLNNSTLLEEAVKLKKYEFVSALVKVGALRDIVNLKTGVAPLHVACQLGDVKLLGLLLGDDVLSK